MLTLSLRTRNPARARFLAGQVTALADTFVTEAVLMGLTPQQTRNIFAQTFTDHLDRLERIAVRERAELHYDPEQERSADQRMGWVYRLLETRGHAAQIDERAVSQMLSEGLDKAAIAEVAHALEDMRRCGFVPERPEKLQKLVEAQGGEPSPMNLMMAEHQLYRARAAACFEVNRRHDGIRVDDAVLTSQILRDRMGKYRSLDRGCTHQPTAAGKRPEQEQGRFALTSQACEAVVPETSLKEIVPADHFVVEIGEKLIVSKTKGAIQEMEWDPKTARQARQIFRLFAKMLCEKHIFHVEQLKQLHFAALVELFNGLAQSYGKSAKDEGRSCTELLSIGKAKDKSERGLAPETINRHLSHLSAWCDFAEGQGIEVDSKINLARLRSKIRGRARSKRGFLDVEHLSAIFSLPCFTGCKSWETNKVYLEPGPLVYHRALYFVPLLLYYTLARREEICGLQVNDVLIVRSSSGMEASITIRWNDQRRVKNGSSIRDIPLHPELIRLGFIEYVEVLSQLGYTNVFPDLVSPTSKSPLGDRFYDEFIPALRRAVPDAETCKQVIHSFRRSAGNELKKMHVNAETRGDILGHKGSTITEEIYSNDLPLAQKLEVLKQLPVVTSMIPLRPINLLPWVKARKPPPFSRASRKRNSTS